MIYLSYSQSQKAYHRDVMPRIVESNLVQLTRGIQADYVIVGWAMDNKQADELFPKIKEKLGRPIAELMNQAIN